MRDFPCEVVRVVDGDTVDVDADLGFDVRARLRVRLAGVDAPETYRPSCEAERVHGEAAKARVRQLLTGACMLRADGSRCKYGRCLGELFPEGSLTSVNSTLREEGLLKLPSYRD